MKRKKMIHDLQWEIYSWMGVDQDTGELLMPEGEYLAASILKYLEESGMQPPSYVNAAGNIINDWEPDGSGE